MAGRNAVEIVVRDGIRIFGIVPCHSLSHVLLYLFGMAKAHAFVTAWAFFVMDGNSSLSLSLFRSALHIIHAKTYSPYRQS